MQFTAEYIFIDDHDIIMQMLVNRDSFDKKISEILSEYFKQTGMRNNKVYIKMMGLNVSQRHKFHMYERPEITFYSVGEKDSRIMIIEFKTKYITNILKKYTETPVLDISEEILSFKNLLITDINQKVEDLLTKLKM